MAIVKAVFYLPLLDNDGRDLAAEIEDTLDQVYSQFGAWTWQGNVRGVFRMADGSRSEDTLSAYIVFLDEGLLVDLERVLRDFKIQTTQEAIFLEIQRDTELRLIRYGVRMTDPIRQQVLDVIANVTQAGPFSERLFGPEGLFNQVARTTEERRRLLQEPLYRQAMSRFMEIQRSEAAVFEKCLHGQKAAVDPQSIRSPSGESR